MKIEVGQIRRYGCSGTYYVVTSSYQPSRDMVELLHEDGITSDDVPIEDVQKGSILISSHPNFYEAIAEMGRLAEKGAA